MRRFLRWILLLIVASLSYALAGFLPTREFAWWLVPALMLMTATAVFTARKLGPSPRLSIVVVGVGIFVVAILSFVVMEAAGRHILFATVACLIGLAVGVMISTTKGAERNKVVLALRWALFLALAFLASTLWETAAEMLLSPVSPGWLNWATVALVQGMDFALFIFVAAVAAPSHRAVVSLTMAAFIYTVLWVTPESFDTFPYTLLGARDSASYDVYVYYLNILAWTLGTAAAAAAALSIPARWHPAWRVTGATESRKQRYKGTAPYQDIDLDRKTFFGRDHETRALLSLVLAERLVVLFAKSGMGKSSLINAGLAEPLRQQGYFPAVVRFNDAQRGPAHSLLDGVRLAAHEGRVDVLGGEGTTAWRFFKTAEFWSEHNDLLRPVLILDQFEEIFTLHGPETRREFIGQLAELVRGRSATHRRDETSASARPALDDAPPDTKIVIALREDFLANLEELAGEIPAILHNRFRLGPLSLRAARAAITEPAGIGNDAFQTATFTYQEAAVERLLAFLATRRIGGDVTASDEIEPVQLQIVCHYLEEVVRTRQAAGGSDATIEISEADLGGEEHMRQVLEGFYDRTIAGVRPRHKAPAVRRLCETRLISRGGRRLTEDHEEIARRFKISQELLRHLVDARLLRAEARLGSTFYEVSHDRLVDPILQSRRRRALSRRWVAAATIVLVMAVVGRHVFEKVESVRRGRERIQLESTLFSPEPGRAIDAINELVAQHQYRVQDVIEKMETRHLNPSALVVLSMESARGGRELSTLKGHAGAVNSVGFSHDGHRLVTASSDGTARVWGAHRGGMLVELKGHTKPVESAAFSPDGQRVVTASDDGTARVWRANGGGTPVVLKGHTGPVVRASFSPDGQRVVTASFDGTVRVWRADGEGPPVVLAGHGDRIMGAAFSPDGRRVVSASFDGTARVWRADGGGTPVVLRGHGDQVWTAAFSPDGQRVVTASRDSTARVWRADGDGTSVVLEGHGDSVRDAAFSPDGQRVVTTSFDGTVRVWRADGGGTPVVLYGDTTLVRTAAFSPDGTMLASAGDDGKVMLWDVEKAKRLATLSGHVGAINDVAFSPNGKTLASAGNDGTAILWNREVQKGEDPHLKEVLGHIEKYYGPAMNASSANRAEVPTLLGALIATLDAAKTFGDPEVSDRAKRLRTRVVQEYQRLYLDKTRVSDAECAGANRTASDSRDVQMAEVTNQQYRCFWPDHSFPPNEARTPIQVNWYEALAYAAYQDTTLPSKASVHVAIAKGAPETTGNMSRSNSTWCQDMDLARDEKQFSLLSAPSSDSAIRPCLAKGRSALLKEKRKFRVYVPPSKPVVGSGQPRGQRRDSR